MNQHPFIGERVLKREIPKTAFHRFKVHLVRNIDDFQRVVAIRAVVYMGEQACPYDEEYDGNDLCASHFLVFDGQHAVGTLRIRWFAGFAKLERITLLPSHRATKALHVLLAEAFEVVARKGYRKMIGQIQARLWPLWSRTFDCKLMQDRAGFSFSDYDYREIMIFVPPHPRAIQFDDDPYTMIRPEGAWDTPGVLDASAIRNTKARHTASASR